MDNAVVVRDLRKQYQTFLLDDISFDVPKGYITGFIGPNGSGKTTTIKSILSYIRTDKGDIEVLSEPLSGSNAYLDKIGVVMDTPFFVKEWKVSDVEKSVRPFYSQWDSTTFHDYLKRFKIKDSLKVKELSRGMGIKLMLALALSHNPELMILDEPTSGLDPVAREEICEILQDFVGDDTKTVFFSTHITSDLEQVADFIVFLINGKVVYQGEKDDLLENYVLIKGGTGDLDLLSSYHLIGLKKHSTGFEAVGLKSEMTEISDVFLIEPITLEKLIIFFHRGEVR